MYRDLIPRINGANALLEAIFAFPATATRHTVP